MKRGGGSQTDQGEVLDDCCHVTSALETLCSEGHVITIIYKCFYLMKNILAAFYYTLSKIFYLHVPYTEYNIFFVHIDNIFCNKHTYHKCKTYHICHYIF